MSCATVQKLEFRCCRCFYSLYAPVEEAGTKKACQYCGTENVVPEATPERIARAEHVGDEVLVAPKGPLLIRDEQMTDEEAYREVRRQNYVAPGEMQYLSGVSSSRIKRFFGAMIDGLLMVVAFIGGVVLVATLAKNGFLSETALRSKELNLEQINALCALYFLPLALAIIQWNMISVHGQTIAKKLLGMRIVTMSGHTPGFFQGVMMRNWLRNLLGVIPFFSLIDVLFIFGDAHRCLHDYIAGTYVVDTY